jgi:hypothetical protein
MSMRESSMIERVERAMCRHIDPDDTASGRIHPSGLQLDDGEPYWLGYIEQAEAVILAMREPTQVMLRQAGGDLSSDRFTGLGMARSAWLDMIDAALGDCDEISD